MLRVRGLTQDDAHIFCTADEVEQEFHSTIDLTRFVLESVGLQTIACNCRCGIPKSDKYVGSEENWQKAEAAPANVLKESGLPYSEAEGEAAFYGPEADFHGPRLYRPPVAIWGPFSSTTTSLSVSNWNTPEPITKPTAR
jgi:threonyl-tRNA synthetase